MRRRGWVRGGAEPDSKRLEALERAVDRLREAAEYGTVVVEGSRDLSALAWLGIGGQHVAIQQGRPLPEVIEDLAASPAPVILLPDWDRTGGRLLVRLRDNLQARVPVDTDCRRRLAAACHSKALEEVPAELSALRSRG